MPDLATLALCNEIVFATPGELPEWIPVLPRGPKLVGRDGREFGVRDITEVMHATKALGRRTPIDINHATTFEAPAGKESPAMGWIDKWRVEDDGLLWGHVAEWTPRGIEAIKNKEYSYTSPALLPELPGFEGGFVKAIHSVGLVNGPNFDMPAINSEDLALNAQWTTAYINDLPDSAFLYIESGGKKDSEGKMTPRSLRHFPYKDASGKVDLPHLRNAIARIPQSTVSGLNKSALQEKARGILARATTSNNSQEVIMDPKEIRKALGLPEEATDEQVEAKLDALKASVTKPVEPPVPALNAAQITEIVNAAVSAAVAPLVKRDNETHDELVKRTIDGYVKAGKIQPNDIARNYYIELCQTPEGLKRTCAFLDQQPAFVSTNSQLVDPGTGKPALNDDEKRVCEMLNISEEDMLKTSSNWVPTNSDVS
jgi:phage I-like protein